MKVNLSKASNVYKWCFQMMIKFDVYKWSQCKVTYKWIQLMYTSEANECMQWSQCKDTYKSRQFMYTSEVNWSVQVKSLYEHILVKSIDVCKWSQLMYVGEVNWSIQVKSLQWSRTLIYANEYISYMQVKTIEA